MSIISFHERYYLNKLDQFEGKTLSDSKIYEARQLLKVLDDLTDEGYTSLNDHMESRFCCLTRFRNLIRKNGSYPFKIDHDRLSETTYEKTEYEISTLIDDLIAKAEKITEISDNPFLKQISDYCEFIDQGNDCAYVFLLRDALLPYIYFRSKKYQHIYPWLISRKSLEDITKTLYVDDDIREPVYDALESGHIGFSSFSAFYKEKALPVIDSHPELKNILLDLLGSIKEKRIIEIESGYVGTIPMMLNSLDERVEFRMYTTAPFLYDTYNDFLYCKRYEEIRKFETLYSQDLLLKYSSFRNGIFYVNMTDDEQVILNSLKEMSFMMNA